MDKLAAISVDLDEIDNYGAIHGLDGAASLSARARHAVYDGALPRLARLFAELSLPATFFVIGRDLERSTNRAAVGRLAQDGHEMANHSYDHRYDLSRLSRAEQLAEVVRGAEAIEACTGERPVGFRAPGYTVSDGLFEVLEEARVAYDSSVFPCPSYYLAKVAAISGIALRGRRSRSVVDTPLVLSAPADPYRVGSPYHIRGMGMLELPIGVTRTATGRLPYIGTSLVLAGERGARWLTRGIVGRPLVNLELHGIDLCDASQDDLGPLVAHQPDLRRSGAEKRAALVEAVRVLRASGYRFVTLAQAARHFA